LPETKRGSGNRKNKKIKKESFKMAKIQVTNKSRAQKVAVIFR
jgi:hypothetical protein